MTDAPAPRRQPMSLAARVTILVGLSMAAVFFAFNLISLRALDQHFIEMDEAELRAVATTIDRELQRPDGLAAAAGATPSLRGHHGTYYLVVDRGGAVLQASGSGPDLQNLLATVPATTLGSAWSLPVWEEGGSHYRGTVVRVGRDGERVAVAMDIDTHLDFTHSFRRIQHVTLVLVLLLALGVAWLAVQWGYGPIRRANARIRGIGSARLHLRLDPATVPLEFRDTLLAFNHMLDRIENGFGQLANFSADIAHELRTPITNLVTQTEVALGQERSAAEYREVLYSALEEFQRLKRMINDMLFLAQTGNDPQRLERKPVDLSALVHALFEYYEAWAEECGLQLLLEGNAGTLHADPDMLRRALGNLLSNAIRHAPRGSSIRVGLSEVAGSIDIEVCNPGTPIDPQDLPRVFDRFFRADPARHGAGEGAGLGLAIVQSIVTAHGGQVEASSDAVATCFRIRLPRDAAARSHQH